MRSWLIRRAQGVKTLRYMDQGEASDRHQRIVAQIIPQLSGLLPQHAHLHLDLSWVSISSVLH